MTKLNNILKVRHYFADKGLYSQSYDFSNSHVDQFADFIREEARLRGLPLADPRSDEIAALAALPPGGGLHFTYDGVHPVKAGNELIARSILRALGVDGVE